MKTATLRNSIRNTLKRAVRTSARLFLGASVLPAAVCWAAAFAQTPVVAPSDTVKPTAYGTPSKAVTSTAVVRHAAGDVRMVRFTENTLDMLDVKAGDLPGSGHTFVTGSDGSMTLRFHPDMMLLELPSSSQAAVKFSDADSGGARLVDVNVGRVQARVAPGATLTLMDEHASALVRSGRVAFTTHREQATVLVLEGEAKVLNRKTGATDVVGAGGKALAGASGTVVTRAGAQELAAAGLRQNVLEVDFWNPATEEYRTLEVEYEARSRAP